jgi:hypothetical protein
VADASELLSAEVVVSVLNHSLDGAQETGPKP